MNEQAIASGSAQFIGKYHNAIRSLIDQDDFDVPMLPEVAAQVIALTQNPNACLTQLSHLIHKDQALAGHVLRIANSAAFSCGVPVVSLSQALARLGMSIVGEIAVAACLKNGVFKATGYEKLTDTLWSHALASGVVGKEIARAKRYSVEGQYLCSLLHTIGKPVVLQMVAQLNAQWREKVDLNTSLALIESHHVEVGKLVAAKWQLPQMVTFAIEYYQDAAAAKQFRREAIMAALSHSFASWLLQSEVITDDALKQNAIFAELNFYPNEIEALMAKKETFLEVVNSLSE